MGAAEHEFDRNYWEDRYGASGLAWSGKPNPVLVTEVTPLTPGRALDIGSGEGADAFWLAQRGWQVTGVDIAVNALDKARAHAESVDLAAAARIDWQQHDFTEWSPQAQSFDLVSSQFMHLPQPILTTLFRALAAAVAPGGTLLIVGHDAADHDAADHDAADVDEKSHHRGHLAELMFSADEVLDAIKGEKLTIETAESRPRRAANGQRSDFINDIVVRARRVPVPRT